LCKGNVVQEDRRYHQNPISKNRTHASYPEITLQLYVSNTVSQI
jgi:hypothetical protein